MLAASLCFGSPAAHAPLVSAAVSQGAPCSLRAADACMDAAARLPPTGGFATAKEIKGWYATLTKPWWNPPVSARARTHVLACAHAFAHECAARVVCNKALRLPDALPRGHSTGKQGLPVGQMPHVVAKAPRFTRPPCAICRTGFSAPCGLASM